MIALGLTVIVSGVISLRLYFVRKNLEKIDLIAIPMISGQQPNNLKGVKKCLPYVNEWARSVLSLTTLYVSKLRHFIIPILQVFFL